jgi:DNA-binding response OmpR family regulator
MKIALIVENDLNFAKLLVDFIMRNTSYHAIHLSNAETALQFTQYIRPNLFIIDYQLPDMSGIDLYQELQNAPAAMGIPTLMIDSALPQAISVARDMVKTTLLFDEDEFIAAIEALLTPSEQVKG